MKKITKEQINNEDTNAIDILKKIKNRSKKSNTKVEIFEENLLSYKNNVHGHGQVHI